MSHLKYLFYLSLLQLSFSIPQLSLYYTDWMVSENDNNLQHTCLRVVSYVDQESDGRNIMSYCMSELPSKFNIQNDNSFPKFTFSDLLKRNITSQQLYLWSAPIDLIEHYQFYLNQLSTTNNSLLSRQIFYNCTMPRFGPMCQYELQYYRSHYLSLNEIIEDFYRSSSMNPSSSLTCYIHMQCHRHPSIACLDWSEICDGKIDCLNGGIDEEHCWQLEINQCKDDEYRCRNGHCIPQSFYGDNPYAPDCMDASDEKLVFNDKRIFCYIYSKPSIKCEDITCVHLPLTSSCDEQRANLLIDIMYSNNDHTVPEHCWSAFKCLIKFLRPEYSTCNEFCRLNDCKKIVMNNCSKYLFFPNVPVLFNNIYFVYRKSDFNSSTDLSTVPFYICYNTFHYDEFFVNDWKIFINNMTCVNSQPYLSLWRFESIPMKIFYIRIIEQLYKLLKQYHLPLNYTSTICNRPNMYQCSHSLKCISIYRLIDGVNDCPSQDDEDFTVINTSNVIEQLEKTHFKCEVSKKYIHRSLIENGDCNCGKIEPEWCEDEELTITHLKRNIIFQHICDGFTDLLPVLITGKNETDETECEQWQCNNIYTRCNGLWNCPNGVDESGCTSHPILNCTSKQHLCVSPKTNQFICLPVEKANDGNVDCLGATDEPKLCRTNIQTNVRQDSYDFYCMNQTFQPCISNLYLCDGEKNCEHGDDEQFCTTNRTRFQFTSICALFSHYKGSEIEHFLCENQASARLWDIVRFRIVEVSSRSEHLKKNIENTILPISSSLIQMSGQHSTHCHRGLNLRVWVNNKERLTNNTCLCPPSYYGDRCQYQNQRISLTIKFRVLSDSPQILFAMFFSLIDDSDQRIIHSYEQFTYLSIRDCQRKFNIYLIYSTRPKDPTKNYSIHIDIYEKMSLTYRGSLLYPVNFSFLPVHRLIFIVNIPSSHNNNVQSCLDKQCIHGRCIKYANNPQTSTFCQCEKGWSGRYCTIQHSCMCSSDSLCVGLARNNRSICVCPLHKFGPRCLLKDTKCQTNNNFTCQNGGQCILDDDDLVPDQEFVCICPKGYSGERCEIVDNQLILSFANDIILSQSIFIHFIEVIVALDDEDSIVRGDIFQTIPLRQDSVVIYWSRPFHLTFIEYPQDKTYYLAVFQKIYNQSAIIVKMIHSSDRCPHINELFNETIIEMHPLRRIKYYHLPCQTYSPHLSCFYDDIHLCLCYDFEQQRLANCFKFDHNMKFDCMGQSVCENGGQCLQDKPDCPTRSICICPPCFYGGRCQFSTSGFGLSLDAILGYHIIPHVRFIQQPVIVKISLTLTIIFIITGLINGILALITFKSKVVREVGCGLYLLGSSITTIIIMIIFGLKFFILLFAQMSILSNRTFLQVQCHSLDFLLRACLCIDQWLNACVALERAFTTIKGASFVKRKSKRAAKFVIMFLIIVSIGTCIHDAIYRRLIDEENDIGGTSRTWCIVIYSSNLQAYNFGIHIFHFFGPFMINLVSSIILITKKSGQQARVHPERNYQEILREQLLQQKHLIISPIILVILAFPRLIITFVSKCMKSADDIWLYLIGYFISFIPPILTFMVFIVPSKFFRKELFRHIGQYRRAIRRRFHN